MSHGILKRGLALTPVKFGISFTTTHLNQAGALVLVYADGSIHLNHGGTEMGQGLMIKVAQVVADAWHVAPDDVVICLADTAGIPMGLGTIASRSTVTAGNASGINDAAAAVVGKRARPEHADHSMSTR